jgi:hypothetical protein
VIVAFCRTNGTWYGQDHRLWGAGWAFFVHVGTCLLKGSIQQQGALRSIGASMISYQCAGVSRCLG